MAERRRHPRFQAPEDCSARVASSIPARVLDVSEGGLGLETSISLRPTSVCEVCLPTRAGSLRVQARVHRCRAALATGSGGFGNRMVYHSGLQFEEIDEEQWNAIAVGFGAAC